MRGCAARTGACSWDFIGGLIAQRGSLSSTIRPSAEGGKICTLMKVRKNAACEHILLPPSGRLSSRRLCIQFLIECTGRKATWLFLGKANLAGGRLLEDETPPSLRDTSPFRGGFWGRGSCSFCGRRRCGRKACLPQDDTMRHSAPRAALLMPAGQQHAQRNAHHQHRDRHHQRHTRH